MLQEFLIWSQGVVSSFGYLGIFIISIIGNATLFFPVPVGLIIFASGAVLNPWIVGLVAGIGCSIGELTGYVVGLGGRAIAGKKAEKSKSLQKAEKMFKKYGFWAIPVLAFAPFVMDFIGLVAGSVKYNPYKFFIGTLIGKIPKCIILAVAGYYSLGWILSVFFVG